MICIVTLRLFEAPHCLNRTKFGVRLPKYFALKFHKSSKFPEHSVCEINHRSLVAQNTDVRSMNVCISRKYRPLEMRFSRRVSTQHFQLVNSLDR